LGTARRLFPGAPTILDFREVKAMVKLCGQPLFHVDYDPWLADYEWGRVDNDGWAFQALNSLWKGDAVGAMDVLEFPEFSDPLGEALAVKELLEARRDIIDYPAWIADGLYAGDGSVSRPSRTGVRDWVSHGAKLWGLWQVQTAAALIDKHVSGLWERDVEGPVRALLEAER
jgi:hypothetical protein